jgi:hypothetical protein
MNFHPKISQGLRIILLVVIVLVLINVIFIWISPQEIVAKIGIENSYLVTFLVASFGGLSSVTSPILYALIATFAAGGAVPWLLGVTGGIGIAIGDALIFVLARLGYKSTQKMHKHEAEKYFHFQEKIPIWVQFVLLYLILGFTPIPNDIIMILLVLLGYKLRGLIPLLLMSGITIATITAYTGEAFLK